MLAGPAAGGPAEKKGTGLARTRLLAPQSAAPPLCPLATAVMVLPADAAAAHLAEQMPSVGLLLEADHKLLGAITRRERCSLCVELKAELRAVQDELGVARKAELAAEQSGGGESTTTAVHGCSAFMGQSTPPEIWICSRA